jgi:hypothetical protein
VLSHIHRTEGDLEAGNSATLGNVMIEMEESGLASVTSCGDIPESNRLRLLSISHFWETGKRRVRFVKSPYDAELGAAIVELWPQLPKAAKGQEYQLPGERGGNKVLPNRITGRGYAELLEEDTASYYKITPSEFFFPIPETQLQSHRRRQSSTSDLTFSISS